MYQRRWKAYWITSALASTWFVAGAILGQNADSAADSQNRLVGLIGLLLLAACTATEAGLAVKKLRQSSWGFAPDLINKAQWGLLNVMII